MMKSKFELPESIFSVTKGFPSKPKKALRMTQNLPLNTSEPLQAQLQSLTKATANAEPNAPKYFKMTKWLAIIGLAAITLSWI